MKKILRVNMSTLSLVTEEPKEDYPLLGGCTFISKYMLAEVKSTTAENAVFDVPEEELDDVHQMSSGRLKA